MLTTKIEDGITSALQRLLAGYSDASEPMSTIGEYLVVSSRRNFEEQHAPDGTPWASRAQSTLKNYSRQRSSFPSRVLHYENMLVRSFHPAHGPNFVEISTNRPYGAMMHFGGTKAQFPHLWGNIPARPFFGLAEEGESDVLDIVSEWIEGLVD